MKPSLAWPEGDSSPPGLTFIIYKMTGGGAQRIIAILANHFAERGWRISLLTYDDGVEPSFYKLHPAIRCVPLSIARHQGRKFDALRVHLSRPFILRRAIRLSKPDIVISFIDLSNILTLVATLGLTFPVVISERINPAYHSIGPFWSLLRKIVYRWSTCLVVQTQDVLLYFPSAIQNITRVIPNPVLPPVEDEKSFAKPSSPKILLAMGRLVEQKGFDLLIKAFSKLKTKFPDWQLNIWGEGDQKIALENLCRDLGLRERVFFKGMSQDSHTLMKQADIFVLSSRYEGFPNVLGEAMACGLPVVSFDCPSGPGDLINNNVNGLLIPQIDENCLAEGLQRLMGDESFSRQLGNEARKITDEYSLNRIMKTWENLFLDILKNARRK